MSSTHKQTFWTIGAGLGDIGAEKRAQIAKAALMLQEHADVVHSSSAGGYNDAEKPEIALTFGADFSKVEIMKSDVEGALAKEGLSGVTVTLEKDVGWFTFEETHLKALKASIPDDFALARKHIYDLVHLPAPKPQAFPIDGDLATELAAIRPQFHPPTVPTSLDGAQPSLHDHGVEQQQDYDVDTAASLAPKAPAICARASDIPGGKIVEPMLITEAKYKRMRDARDDKVREEISGLTKALDELSRTTKTNTAVLIMIAGGLIAVGTKMITAYKAITAAVSLFAAISVAITAIGGVLVLAGIVTVIVAVLLILLLGLKDAANELVLVNGLELKPIDLTSDCIISGERLKVTMQVPAAIKSSKKPHAYGCGFYTYRKTRAVNVPVGFFGSTAGMGFKAPSDDTKFSVGVDCPNSILGGTNSICVKAGSDAMSAANSAASSGHSTESIKVNGHNCVASRASPWGSINYGICSVE